MRQALRLLLPAVFLTVGASSAFASEDEPIGWPRPQTDCTCNDDGQWQASNPNAHAIWPGGRCEDRVNVRRCREINEAAGTELVCRPGTTRNIYTSPAPAIVNGPCP